MKSRNQAIVRGGGNRWWIDYRRPGGFPEARYWEFEGGRLAWNEFGDAGGYPVVFHHGWPSSRWQAQVVDSLAKERGLRVLALDRPGLGRSPWVPGFRIDDWPRLVAGFLDALGIGKFSQLAVSGGGPYAVACAANLVERVTTTSILCGAAPLTVGSVGRLPLAYRMLEKARHLPDWMVDCGLKPASVLMGCPTSGPVMSWLLRFLPEADRELLDSCPDLVGTLMAACREGLSQGGRALMESGTLYLDDWRIDPSRVRGALRFWHGAKDLTIPVELAAAFARSIPMAEWIEVPEDAHFSLAIHQAAAALDALSGGNPEQRIHPRPTNQHADLR